jgi:hypothetical protein
MLSHNADFLFYYTFIKYKLHFIYYIDIIFLGGVLMEDMYNMKDTVQMHSCCPMMTCPMMVRQPSMANCMNNNMYGAAAMSCQHGAAPIRSTIANPYFFQTEMKPVPIEEIED